MICILRNRKEGSCLEWKERGEEGSCQINQSPVRARRGKTNFLLVVDHFAAVPVPVITCAPDVLARYSGEPRLLCERNHVKLN